MIKTIIRRRLQNSKDNLLILKENLRLTLQAFFHIGVTSVTRVTRFFFVTPVTHVTPEIKSHLKRFFDH